MGEERRRLRGKPLPLTWPPRSPPYIEWYPREVLVEADDRPAAEMAALREMETFLLKPKQPSRWSANSFRGIFSLQKGQGTR